MHSAASPGRGQRTASDGSGTTTSIAAAETVTGSHEFVVQGYSKSKGALGVGRCVFSRSFAVGGHSWCIAYYPDGAREEHAQYITFVLLIDHYVEGDVRAQITFSLLDQAGQAVPLYTRSSGTWTTFSRTDTTCLCELIKREVLESSPYLQNDSFRIKCDVTVFKNIRRVEAALPEPHRQHICDGGSITTMSAETVTVSHLLIIKDYSNTKGVVGVGKCFHSGSFNVGGHNWCVTYYPDGFCKNSEGHIAVFLRIDPAVNGDVKARVKFSLLDQVGEPLLPYTTKSNITTFSGKTKSMGFKKFIDRNQLELSPYLIDGSFKILCEVTVLKESMRTTTPQLPALPPSDLHRHLGDLLACQVGWDVLFEVGGETFMAHRNVLAIRSPVFMAELFGPMMERTAARVRINDMLPVVFKAFLHFMYTDSLPEIDTGEEVVMAQHLLVAADRYYMERLRMICEHILYLNIDTSTAATTLTLAEQHGCRGLKEACLKFIAFPCNLKVIMASNDFEHLMISCPSLLKELAASISA